MAPTIQIRVSPAKPKLLDNVRDVIRRKHYSFRTEQAYVDWIRRFILFHGKRHPSENGGGGGDGIPYLPGARTQGGSLDAEPGPQRAALPYQEVLKQKIGWLEQLERVKRPARLPVVLTKDEVRAIFVHLHGTRRLMAGLLYGSGMRLMECVRLRVKDVEGHRTI